MRDGCRGVSCRSNARPAALAHPWHKVGRTPWYTAASLSWEIAVRKTLLAAAALLASSVAVESVAQPAFVPRKQVSPEAARKLVDACIAYARANNAVVGVAVVDFAGVLIDMHLMQGGTATSSETAILKAKTAAHWQRATSQL